MVSLNEKRSDNVYTGSNYSSYEDEDDYENDSDYSPANKTIKISSNDFYNGGKGKSISPFSLDEQFQSRKSVSKRGPPQKCFSRNALMARENRVKKKLYIASLEAKVEKYSSDKKTLTSILNNQSCIITDLRKEVKYLKSVVANSSDISKLLKGIQLCTGMSVTTSVDKSLTFKNQQNDNFDSIHPWIDNNSNNFNSASDTLLNDLDVQEYAPLLLDDYLPDTSGYSSESLIKIPESSATSNVNKNDEHNYTVKCDFNSSDIDEEPGICLHIANNKISLEFCSICNERAAATWQTVDEGNN